MKRMGSVPTVHLDSIYPAKLDLQPGNPWLGASLFLRRRNVTIFGIFLHGLIREASIVLFWILKLWGVPPMGLIGSTNERFVVAEGNPGHWQLSRPSAGRLKHRDRLNSKRVCFTTSDQEIPFFSQAERVEMLIIRRNASYCRSNEATPASGAVNDISGEAAPN